MYIFAGDINTFVRLKMVYRPATDFEQHWAQPRIIFKSKWHFGHTRLSFSYL